MIARAGEGWTLSRSEYPSETRTFMLTGPFGAGIGIAGDLLVEAALLDGLSADCSGLNTSTNLASKGWVDVLVRVGGDVTAPLANLVAIDGLVAAGLACGRQALARLKPNGVAVLDDDARLDTPADRIITQDRRVVYLPHYRRHDQVLHERLMLSTMLGVLSRYLPIRKDAWKESFATLLPPRRLAECWPAFERGRRELVDLQPGV